MEHKAKEKFTKEIARDAAREAVKETLASIGFDTNNPQEMQADLLYLKKIRKHNEYTTLRTKAAIITICTSALLYLLWETIKKSINTE